MRSEIKFGISTLLAMAWILVIGCGGGNKPTPPAPSAYVIGGTVSGLSGTGLVLEDNGGNNLTVSAGATTFSFSTPVASAGVYSVTVLTQPGGESCAVASGSGTATANVTNISVTCTAACYTIKAQSLLTGMGLVPQDNGGDFTVAAPTPRALPSPLRSPPVAPIASRSSPSPSARIVHCRERQRHGYCANRHQYRGRVARTHLYEHQRHSYYHGQQTGPRGQRQRTT